MEASLGTTCTGASLRVRDLSSCCTSCQTIISYVLRICSACCSCSLFLSTFGGSLRGCLHSCGELRGLYAFGSRGSCCLTTVCRCMLARISGRHMFSMPRGLFLLVGCGGIAGFPRGLLGPKLLCDALSIRFIVPARQLMVGQGQCPSRGPMRDTCQNTSSMRQTWMFVGNGQEMVLSAAVE